MTTLCECGCGEPARRRWASDACRRRATPPELMRLPFLALPDNLGASFEVVMRRLLALPTERIVVAYQLSRTVNEWCGRLPRKTLTDLVDRESRRVEYVDKKGKTRIAYRSVRYAGFRFDYLPEHWWRVRFGQEKVTVYDVWRLFGVPLTDALAAWEATDLADLMEQFRAGCEHVGFIPDGWDGPGRGASALLRAWEIKEHLAYYAP